MPTCDSFGGESARRIGPSSKPPLLPWHPRMPVSIAIYSVLVNLMFPNGRSTAKMWIWVGQLNATGCPLLENTCDRITWVQNRVSFSPHSQVQKNAHQSGTLWKPQDTAPLYGRSLIGIVWLSIQDISQHLTCAMTSSCSLLTRPTDSLLHLFSPADFWPLDLYPYPTCLLCRIGSCCLCAQNISFRVTNSPVAKCSCRNEPLPSLACIYYHCKQQHCPEPLSRCLLVICYQNGHMEPLLPN